MAPIAVGQVFLRGVLSSSLALFAVFYDEFMLPLWLLQAWSVALRYDVGESD